MSKPPFPESMYPDRVRWQKKTAKGKIYWFLMFNTGRDGKDRYIRIRETDPSSPEFQATYSDLFAQHCEGGNTVRSKATGTVSEVFVNFKTAHYPNLKPRTMSDYDKILARIEVQIGDYKWDDLEGSDIVDLLKTFKNNSSARRSARGIMLQIAKWMGDPFEPNKLSMQIAAIPTQKVRKLKAIEDIPWTAEMIRDFHQHCSEGRANATFKLQALIRILHWSHQRVEDVLHMRWRDIQDDHWNIVTRKTGHRVKLRLSKSILSVLDDLRRDNIQASDHHRSRPTGQVHDSDYVFVSKGTNLRWGYNAASMQLQKLRKGTSYAGVSFHGLRHTAAREHFENGGTLAQYCAITGHDMNDDMPQHYSASVNNTLLAEQSMKVRGMA